MDFFLFAYKIFMIALSFIAQYPMLRTGVLLIFLAFLMGIWVSVWSVYIPAKSLYRAPKGKQGETMSLSSIKQEVREGSCLWLFYHEELFYITAADALSEQERELYTKALQRLDDGGGFARNIGTRVYLPSRREARKYLHFIGSKASVGVRKG